MNPAPHHETQVPKVNIHEQKHRIFSLKEKGYALEKWAYPASTMGASTPLSITPDLATKQPILAAMVLICNPNHPACSDFETFSKLVSGECIQDKLMIVAVRMLRGVLEDTVFTPGYWEDKIAEDVLQSERRLKRSREDANYAMKNRLQAKALPP